MQVEFEATLWLWEARKEAWTFVTVPEELSDMIREVPRMRRGFGAVRVQVACGSQRWGTSIFPGASEGAYVLPIKKAVRDAESLMPGDVCSIQMDVSDA